MKEQSHSPAPQATGLGAKIPATFLVALRDAAERPASCFSVPLSLFTSSQNPPPFNIFSFLPDPRPRPSSLLQSLATSQSYTLDSASFFTCPFGEVVPAARVISKSTLIHQETPYTCVYFPAPPTLLRWYPSPTWSLEQAGNPAERA